MDATQSVRSAWRGGPIVRGALVWLAALVPFVAAVAAHAVGLRPQSPLPAPPRPALAVDRYLLNLGESDDVRFVVGRFGFRNAGELPLEITDLQPSCGCLKPQLDKRIYAPGEEGELFLRVQTAGEAPGPHEYFVDVKYADPEPRGARLTLKVVLPEAKVVVRPKALVFYQLGTQETTREITVTDMRTGRKTVLEPVEVKSSSDLARVALAGVDEDEDGHRRIRLTVTAAADVPPGIHRALISLRTNDAEHSLLQVPVVVQGRAE